jgi:CsoR family transcriptional regulator, copper-sensing transcriptional repressor
MTPETRRRAQRRLRIIAGQVKALERRVEADRYPMELLALSLSIQRALQSLDTLVLEGHLRTHVLQQMMQAKPKPAVNELLRLYHLKGPTGHRSLSCQPKGAQAHATS